MGFGKDGKGFILYDRVTISPGALAALDMTAASSGYSNLLQEDFRIIKSEFDVVWKAGVAGDQVYFGIMSGELDAAMAEECIEARPTQVSDIPEAEQSMRPVWPLGILIDSGGGTPATRIEKSLRWTFNNPEGWSYWAYNPDASTALTTGGELIICAKHFGVWVN